MWKQWYRMRPALAWLFLVVSVLLIGAFLYFSHRTVRSLEREERAKMEIWASAYRQLFLADADADMTIELQIIHGNTTIPVFYTEEDGTLLGVSNIELPEDTAAYLAHKIPELRARGNYFEVNIADDWTQYLYYDESRVLQQLQYYPYIQLTVILIFVALFYYFFASRKRFEQNRVWVGLSKETAHQLGTPITSLMGWIEYLRAAGAEGMPMDAQAVTEMEKDVQRLHTVADRFSKIGSTPRLEPTDLLPLVGQTAAYMQKRAPQHVTITAAVPSAPVERPLCAPLFVWVIENLCRNAIDAMKEGRGHIRLTLRPAAEAGGRAVIEVEDDGCGIPKNRQKDIFRAGYTTKQRGWGLGLALVKRIVEDYHHGRIYVKSSTPGVGTTFRVEV